jgi:hypothetical protein
LKPAKPTPRPKPDEAGDADPATVDALNAQAHTLTDTARTWVAGIIEAARAAKYPIRLSGPGGRRTLRRQWICAALLILAGFEDDDLTRALVSIAIGEQLQPGHDLGAAIGSLELTEAQNLQRLAAAVASTSLVPIWGDDGVAITGDITAALAA